MCLGLRERQNEVDRPTDRQTKRRGVGGGGGRRSKDKKERLTD